LGGELTAPGAGNSPWVRRGTNAAVSRRPMGAASGPDGCVRRHKHELLAAFFVVAVILTYHL
jgi:hypothetical protein